MKFFLFILFFIVCTTDVYAYLDPGTGSIIVQAIIGAVATIFTSVYIYWNKFKLLIKKLFIILKKKISKNEKI